MDKRSKTFGWGVWGAGEIARDFCLALGGSTGSAVHRVGGRSLEKVRAFAREFNIPEVSSSLDDLLRDPRVDAVYVATPHPFHEDAALACIAAGRPVLVEKPLAPSAHSVRRIAAAAESSGVVVREGYMYRCHPLMGEVERIVRENVLGKIHRIEADFGFSTNLPAHHRLMNQELAGGAIWDVGGYPISFAGFVAGFANSPNNVGDVHHEGFSRPKASFTAEGGVTGVAMEGEAHLTYEGGLEAILRCSIQRPLGTRAAIIGENGVLVLDNPWLPGGDRQGTETSYSLTIGNGPEQKTTLQAKPVFLLEAECFEAEVRGAKNCSRSVTLTESIYISELLEPWNAAL